MNNGSAVSILRFMTVFACLALGNSVSLATEGPAKKSSEVNPLVPKEEMIRDRFQRFQDRMFQLRTDLEATEPDSAGRLARAMERCGELGLADELQRLIKLLQDPSALNDAVDGQAKWLADADRLLNILLAQDSENKEREKKIDQLEEYKRQLDKILEDQRGLRTASGQASAAQRMLQQINQAIRRTEALQSKQGDLSKKSAEQDSPSSSGKAGARADLAEQQEQLKQEAEDLAEDLKKLSGSPSDETPPAEAGRMEAAKKETASASQSMQAAGGAMSKASEGMKPSQGSKQPGAEGKEQQPQDQQKEAEQALQKAKEQLEAAKKELQQQGSAAAKSGDQRATAQQTKSLSNQMRGESESQGQDGSSGKQSKGSSGKSGKPSAPKSGPENLDKAEQEMEDAAEALEEEKPEEAAEPQDRAIEQLEEVQRALEEELLQLRKEEREEMLRDLEGRFRELLSKQLAVNEGTLALDQLGLETYPRPEQLQLADLAFTQRALAAKAETCVHILEEEGTTVAFPFIVGQIADDMAMVADRLAGFDTGGLTQTIEQEIVDALQQLLDALKKMREENQQQSGGGGGGGGGGKQPPLLPTSAELKLLRSSQQRVNVRTTVIEETRQSGRESIESLHSGLRKVAVRQRECAEIAKQMRDRGE